MKLMPQNHEIISRHEQRLTREITEAVLEKPELTVWMILIPFLLIPFMQRQQKYRQMCDEFICGCLFTKNLALDAAVRVSSGIPELTVVEELKIAVKNKPDAERAIQMVYQAQLEEIDLLKNHYCRLLSTEAAEYAEMVRKAYRPEDYRTFLAKLAHSERFVNEALTALNSLPDLEWRDITDKLEEETIQRRSRDADQIFSNTRR